MIQEPVCFVWGKFLHEEPYGASRPSVAQLANFPSEETALGIRSPDSGRGFLLALRSDNYSLSMVAAGSLPSLGIIECSRGNVTILDRKRLEDRACSCYEVIENQKKKWQSEILPHE